MPRQVNHLYNGNNFSQLAFGVRLSWRYHCANANCASNGCDMRTQCALAWQCGVPLPRALVNGESMMPQRRTDEQTALAAEYALYLVDIRGVQFALSYLDTCNVSRSILTRALQSPELRRHHERRKQARND